MRIQHLALIAATLIATALPASAASGKFGVQAGLVNNSLTGELPKDGSWQGRSSFGAGLVIELDLAVDVAISLQPKFTPRYSSQVFKENGEIVRTVDYDLDYLGIPLLVRVTGDPVGVRGFVTAGLDLGILLDASVSEDGETSDITDDFNTTSFGALFGGGVMVPVGRQLLTFELRYVQGLSDIVARDDVDPDPEFAAPSVKYRGLEFMVGFLFTLGGE